MKTSRFARVTFEFVVEYENDLLTAPQVGIDDLLDAMTRVVRKSNMGRPKIQPKAIAILPGSRMAVRMLRRPPRVSEGK